jgi:hypothetical protein
MNSTGSQDKDRVRMARILLIISADLIADDRYITGRPDLTFNVNRDLTPLAKELIIMGIADHWNVKLTIAKRR